MAVKLSSTPGRGSCVAYFSKRMKQHDDVASDEDVPERREGRGCFDGII